MADIQKDILAALRMQEASLPGVLETVRQGIQTILSTQTAETPDGMNTESTDVERRFMNQITTFRFATNQARFQENLEMLRHRGPHRFSAIQKTFPGSAANQVPTSRQCGPVEQAASRLQR